MAAADCIPAVKDCFVMKAVDADGYVFKLNRMLERIPLRIPVDTNVVMRVRASDRMINVSSLLKACSGGTTTLGDFLDDPSNLRFIKALCSNDTSPSVRIHVGDVMFEFTRGVVDLCHDIGRCNDVDCIWVNTTVAKRVASWIGGDISTIAEFWCDSVVSQLSTEPLRTVAPVERRKEHAAGTSRKSASPDKIVLDTSDSCTSPPARSPVPRADGKDDIEARMSDIAKCEMSSRKRAIEEHDRARRVRHAIDMLAMMKDASIFSAQAKLTQDEERHFGQLIKRELFAAFDDDSVSSATRVACSFDSSLLRTVSRNDK
eukprot:jgi/Mesvir1/11571/Mv04333-RA.1